MITLALAAVLCALVTLPRLVRLDDASAIAGAAIWFSALALRALTTVAVALYVVLVLPTTGLFAALSHRCWHAVVPLLTTHLGLDGHRVADVAVVLPAFVLAASLLSVGFGVVHAARRLARHLGRSVLGPGPADTVMVGGHEVLVAAAGFHRPRVLVSAGALIALDDEELAASLDHERAHIIRRHRFVLVVAELLRALGRFLPGTRAAMRELVFHLERDADGWAVARRHDPVALASAICKAATTTQRTSVVATALAGGSVQRRVEGLVGRRDGGRSSRGPLGVLAGLMVTATLLAAAALPAAAAADERAAPAEQQRHCSG